ncbi:MAG TPA: zinc finger domain-containing protein, partial [Acetobacteraceae bacterium]|nr:zinc finger domain-containing protein [Acetobacteraceae bacterium]
ARFGETESVHLQLFPRPPETWRNAALGAKWARLRELRRLVTVPIEEARRTGTIHSSLEASATLALTQPDRALLDEAGWEEIAIVSKVRLATAEAETLAVIEKAPGAKCARCWRVLEEVGSRPAHPTLCVRCADAVDSGLVCGA